MLVKSTVMSCTAPKKIPPITIHSQTGCHPNARASVGPTIGPAPAMAAKCWAKATCGPLSTKSRSSACVTEGVGVASFSP